MTTFFWSDTHFNHRGILKYCASTRPYADVLAMNEALTARWNSVVKPGDDIYHLGDFGFKNNYGESLHTIFGRLNGNKHLIIGNHDEEYDQVLKLPWISRGHMATVGGKGHRVVICHYPLESWKKAHKGYLMLHGHCHGSLKRTLPHRFDMGADVWDVPQTLERMQSLAAKQTFQPTDHHVEHGEDL